MKTLSLLFLLLLSTKAMACSCAEVNPVLEFYSSTYVFEGKIISKVYAKDSLTYTVTFDITKHYKKGATPKTLAFKVSSERKYRGYWTSCDWKANLGERWLVYAYTRNNTLYFNGMCSNSRRIDRREISQREQRQLTNGNAFRINDYIYEHENEFNYCKNVTKINPILAKGKSKNFKTQGILLYVLVDPKGNLQSVFRSTRLIRKRDSLFNLLTEVTALKNTPMPEFDYEALELIKQVKKWDIKSHEDTGISVSYLRHIWVYYDAISRRWSYEL